jgi:hypothetical protein
MLGQASLILVGTILRPSIRMMNAALGRLPQSYSHVQSSDRQIPLHPVAHSPADDAARVQIQADS